MNTTAQVPGIFAPIITSYFVQHYGDATGYRIVFWICCVLYTLGALAFTVLANETVVQCTRPRAVHDGGSSMGS
jgi:MFS family permease